MRKGLILAFSICALAALAACQQSGGAVHVDKLEPPQGTTNGGEEVSIIGGGFVPGKTQAQVFFGRKRVENVVIASGSKIKVITPSSEKGPVDIKIDFDDGQSFQIPQGFRFLEPATEANARKAFFGGGEKKSEVEKK